MLEQPFNPGTAQAVPPSLKRVPGFGLFVGAIVVLVTEDPVEGLSSWEGPYIVRRIVGPVARSEAKAWGVKGGRRLQDSTKDLGWFYAPRGSARDKFPGADGLMGQGPRHLVRFETMHSAAEWAHEKRLAQSQRLPRVRLALLQDRCEAMLDAPPSQPDPEGC